MQYVRCHYCVIGTQTEYSSLRNDLDVVSTDATTDATSITVAAIATVSLLLLLLPEYIDHRYRHCTVTIFSIHNNTKQHNSKQYKTIQYKTIQNGRNRTCRRR